MSQGEITPTWRSHAVPRAIAIAVIRRNDRLLVTKVTQDDGRLKGYRPLGGGIDLGETAAQALVREFREEVSAEIRVGARLAVLENIFTHEGQIGHELVFVFDAHIIKTGAIESSRFLRTENGRVTAVDWVPLDRFRSGVATLFPDGLAALI
ncbi:NUDIX domain-containing protein [Gymnodinialimonas sp. 2305UL16-5]|uniref:NUDIX hydrolase n=1 Tax=Gymnodinialimonas mytili TaxID=3126503 RepID=UPI0030B1B854